MSWIIDVHNHMIPTEVLEFAQKKGLCRLEEQPMPESGASRYVVHREGYRYPLHASFVAVDAKLEELEMMRVDRAVISVAPPFFFYDLEPAEGKESSRRANEGMARLVAESGGVLAGMATLPLQDPEAAAKELLYAVEELGLVGAEIGPGIAGSLPLDHPAFTPLFQAATDLDVPLFIHPYYTGTKPGMEDYYLTNVVANPLDTTVCLFRLAYAGVFDRFPNLKLLAAHGGGFAPYQFGRANWAHQVRPECQTGYRPPGEQLQNVYYDTLLFSEAALNYLVSWAHPERVVLGSDAPFDMGHPEPREQVEKAGLPTDRLSSILGANAQRLFRWPSPALAENAQPGPSTSGRKEGATA